MTSYPRPGELPWKGYKLDESQMNASGWAPLEGSQCVVLSHPFVFELLYHGTRGPGKSDTLLIDFAQCVNKGFGLDYRGIIFRRVHKELKDLIKKSLKIFPKLYPEARFLMSPTPTWKFPGGEELSFEKFNTHDDYWNYHGQEFQFVGWDELTNWPDLEGYTSMFSCVRSTNPDIPLRVRATTNPYGPGHNQVKYHFSLPSKDGKIMRRNHKFENPATGETVTRSVTSLAVKGTIWENTYLDESYILNIKAQADNPAKVAAWLEGSWDIVSGGMFDDVWRKDINVVPRFPIPSNWRLDRSFDWGSSKPFSVGWWAESDGSDYQGADGQWRSSVRGDLFRVAEWYGCKRDHKGHIVPNKGLQMLNVEISKGIVEMEEKLFPGRKVSPGPADNQITTVVNGTSISRDMQKQVRTSDGRLVPGITWTTSDKAKGSRIQGWEKMRTMMKNAGPAKLADGRLVPREHPGLFVFDSCPAFIDIVPTLPRDDKVPDDLDSETEDHLADEARYRVLAGGRTISSGTTTGLV